MFLYVVGEPKNKILIIEDILLNTDFWVIIYNFIYIKAAVLYNGLSNKIRLKLINEFKDFNFNLIMLVIIYNINI